MRFVIILFITSLLFGATFDDFNAFEQFEKSDVNNFSNLKQKIQECTKEWNFECAKDNLHKIKKYITKKSDNEIIASLWDELTIQEQKKLQAQRAAARAKSIAIRNCSNGSNGSYRCMLYVDNAYDGIIFYNYNSDQTYQISIIGSKNALPTEGFYDPNLNRIWTTRCGDSVYGRSKKIFVYDVSKAMPLFANCAINNKY